MMGMLDISASALSAERLRMQVIAGNVANAETLRDSQGNFAPFRRKLVMFRERALDRAGAGNGASAGRAPGGVEVAGIIEDKSALRRVYQPGHPDADRDGYVMMPNVNTVMEMVDMMAASRAYEANITAMEATKSMFTTSLKLLG